MDAVPVPYNQVAVPQELVNTVNSLGVVSAVILPAIQKSADSLSQIQYAINVEVSNLYDSFGAGVTNVTPQLEKLRVQVLGILADPNFKNSNTTRALLMRAASILQSMDNVDIQLGQILKAAIEDGSKCLRQLGSSVSMSLAMKTGIVPATSQKVRTHVSHLICESV